MAPRSRGDAKKKKKTSIDFSRGEKAKKQKINLGNIEGKF